MQIVQNSNLFGEKRLHFDFTRRQGPPVVTSDQPKKYDHYWISVNDRSYPV